MRRDTFDRFSLFGNVSGLLFIFLSSRGAGEGRGFARPTRGYYVPHVNVETSNDDVMRAGNITQIVDIDATVNPSK